MSENMRHRCLLLAVCGWAVFMLLFVSKFITLTLRDKEEYGTKPQILDKTVTNYVKKLKPQEQTLYTDDQPSQSTLNKVDPHWDTVHAERFNLLKNICRNTSLRNLTHSPITKFVLDRIFVRDKHKILFCQTPKVGNTQWKKVLIVLNGEFKSIEDIPEPLIHNHERNGLPRLSSYSEPEITKRLNTYFKFFIVRDPFERLISAFKDKFLKNPRFEPWYRYNIAPAIIQKYRRNRTETKGLQFDDFIRYLGDPNHKWLDIKIGEPIIHWATYVELCAPCEIKYNVIGHHETLEKDAPYILRKAGINNLVSYPPIPPGITAYNRTKVEQYFSGISKRDIKRLHARFQGDFKLFGYDEPEFLLN
ncbi:carbohydrate sulfotransferase 10 isoform X1 [Carcharodon carcharias]|uniref:carbohydrate sulfotransferase 10 isoform X1 n=1 Tax=Carcharodon carcharias TaxID=13397 RepID=UPI001B7E3948|nr:carbohydrate sulfotransferase 10 isoform X1 [Carcharodon carcharias]